MVDGVKVFHLTAGDVEHQFAPDLKGLCFGYNGQVHGPTIEATEGDHVRIYVTNRLESPTTVHWHGMFVPSGMDGVGGLSHRPIHPGETFKYEFELKQHGTFMYHPHHDEMVQMAMGLMGMFIVHPKEPVGPPVDRDYVYMLSEWALKPGLLRPDPYEMTDFNVLTMNGKAFPGTSPIHAIKGERVRVRFGNLSAMDHHPMHLHGHNFLVTATDGGQIAESAQWPQTTVLVSVGSTRTIEFVADNPGDWAFHCHMTHHMMTQMGHGIPNLVNVDQAIFDAKVAAAMPSFAASGAGHMGAEEGMEMGMAMPRNSAPMFGGRGPHGYISMGGMFTIFKVRKADAAGDEWYQAPADTMARPATEDELRRDGIDPRSSSHEGR
jgi:FtsP/CotA-like multicopper oxidase with cupredoxin domain